MIRKIFIFNFLLITGFLQAQQSIMIQSNRCDFQRANTSSKHYIFNLNNKWGGIANRLLTVSQAIGKVKIVSSNVPTVSAVTSTAGEKYILINPDFLDSLDNTALSMGMMAHALAHHLAGHTLSTPNRAYEEVEADEFTGHLLCKLAISLLETEMLAEKTKVISEISLTDRKDALVRGWKKSNAALNGAPGLSFYNNGEKNIELSFPHFPWPPPEWSCRHQLPTSAFSNCKKYGDVDKIISDALYLGGYTQPSYFQVPGGFAIVTQMEQYNPDGAPKSVPARWDAKKVRQEAFSMLDYLKSLVYPVTGLFRVCVFVVTPKPFNSSGNQIPKEEAINWLNQGFNKPPDAVKNQTWNSSVNVTYLVYEFVVSDGDKKVSQNRPGKLPGIIHLEKTKILNAIIK